MNISSFNQLKNNDKNRILKNIMSHEFKKVSNLKVKLNKLKLIQDELNVETDNFSKISHLCILLRMDAAMMINTNSPEETREAFKEIYHFADDWHNLRSNNDVSYCSPKVENLIKEYLV